MSSIQVTRNIPLPAATVWPTLAAYQGIHLFHPFVESVSSENHKNEGVGAHRTCHFYDGTSLDEVVTSWSEGKGYEVELSNFPMPLKEARARMSVTPLADGTARVSMAMDFRAKWGPAGWLMSQVMMKPMMKRLFGKILKGLAQHVETGDIIGKDGVVVRRALLSAVG